MKRLNKERNNVDNVPVKIKHEEIMELRSKEGGVYKEIEPQQAEYKRTITEKIREIEENEEYKSILEKIKQNREMIASVNYEFERDR